MVKEVRLGKEIVVTVANKAGVLAEMSKLLADSRINIAAAAGYAVGNEAKVTLVTEDNLRAMDALKKAGYNSIKENEVVMVDLENKPGALRDITAKMATAGIDIKQAYGTACPSGCPARIIFSTSDNARALATLKE